LSSGIILVVVNFYFIGAIVFIL